MKKEKKELTKIRLHGFLSEKLKKEWNLSVKSVGEAIRAIDALTKNGLTNILYQKNKIQARYKIIINNKIYKNNEGLEDDLSKVKNSSLTIKRKIKTLDIVPVIEGSGKAFDALLTVVGAVLMVVAIVASSALGPWGPAMFVAGLGMFAAGISNLLSKPPKTPELESQSESYLFSGPANVIGEGRPVQVGYGKLRIGSHRVAASFKVSYKTDNGDVVDCY